MNKKEVTIKMTGQLKWKKNKIRHLEMKHTVIKINNRHAAESTWM